MMGRVDPVTDLFALARLPLPLNVVPLEGWGLDNRISYLRLPGGKEMVLREFPEPRDDEHYLYRFLSDHGVPAPALLASSPTASLLEFVPGETFGDLVERHLETEADWRAVGHAFRTLHAVRFGPRMAGKLLPGRIEFRQSDPVEALHQLLEDAKPGLEQRLPAALQHLDALHGLVDHSAESLRAAPAALGHGDINLWNIIIDSDRAVLIDWDGPVIRDPAEELALVQKHASLFGVDPLPRAFYKAYGPVNEPNTTLHRVLQTLSWAAGDWQSLVENPRATVAHHERFRGWLVTLQAYLDRLPEHIAAIEKLITRAKARRTAAAREFDSR